MENKNTRVLVTGGSGFVGVHTILQLLQQGYAVRTTLRSMSKKEEVLQMLSYGGIHNFDHLSFMEADLTKDDHWSEAVQDCIYVLHIASPIGLAAPKNEAEMIRPAVDGTLRVLRAARDAKVKRVVITSNFGAVGYSHKGTGPITELDHTDPNQKGLSTYNKSKTLAERAAWDFMEKEGGSLELATIHPVGIFGPSLGPDLSSGFELIKKIWTGEMKAIPQLELNVIDVRDVADLHLRAMIHPKAKGERFLALSGGKIGLPEIARLLRKQYPQKRNQITARVLPNWALQVMALFSPQAKAIASMMRTNRNASNAKAKEVLGWQPLNDNAGAILESIQSMLTFGNIS